MTTPEDSDTIVSVLRNQGAAIIEGRRFSPPSLQGVKLLAPWKGGDASECSYIRGLVSMPDAAHFLRDVCSVNKQGKL